MMWRPPLAARSKRCGANRTHDGRSQREDRNPHSRSKCLREWPCEGCSLPRAIRHVPTFCADRSDIGGLGSIMVNRSFWRGQWPPGLSATSEPQGGLEARASRRGASSNELRSERSCGKACWKNFNRPSPCPAHKPDKWLSKKCSLLSKKGASQTILQL